MNDSAVHNQQNSLPFIKLCDVDWIYCVEQPDASDKHILPSTQQIFMKDVRYHQGMKIKSMLSQLCGKGILEHKSHKSGSAMDPSVAELPETFTGVGTYRVYFRLI